MADARTDVTVEIVLPHPPSDDLHAQVYDCLGIVPDVKGPDRDLDGVGMIIVFFAWWSHDILRDRFGNAALDRVLRFLRTVLNQEKATTGIGPGARGDGEMRLVVGARQGVTFVVDHEVAADARAVAAMLEVDISAHPDGATLHWHPDPAKWLP